MQSRGGRDARPRAARDWERAASEAAAAAAAAGETAMLAPGHGRASL